MITRLGELRIVVPLVLGCVLVFVGFAILGLDIGSCPTMGYDGIIASCVHTFPGTDIPITPTGDMVMIIGGVLIAATLTVMLYRRLIAPKV